MDFGRPLQVVSPTLDGDVLVVLAGAVEAFSGRRIHQLVGHGSEPGIRRAAERLVGQGIVLRHQAGRANLYRLNRDHVCAEAIELLAQARSQLISWLREEIASWRVRPSYAALFGSAARGQAGPDSDLDLLVVRSTGVGEDSTTWTEQLATLERSASSWTGNDARIVELAEHELGQAKPLLGRVLADGVELFGSLQGIRSEIGGVPQ
jgi:predicted nucleotidyltransferase